MRLFCLVCRKFQSVTGKLTWTHYCELPANYRDLMKQLAAGWHHVLRRRLSDICKAPLLCRVKPVRRNFAVSKSDKFGRTRGTRA